MAEISLQEYYGRVEDMIDQGRYAQAVAHGKHILGAYPKYVAGYRLLGRAMLEARRDDDALDMFLRVLSANPEDMLSWVAMSEIYDRRDELAAAVWCLERAFELSVDNQLVGEELRQLYGRRDGVVPERVELTRGALARLYLKGDLLSRSVSEFRTLLDEQPDRVDLEVAFAEALWRNEQRLEASEVCQRVLDKLPYCLKANLLLGEIWVNSGREEGQTYLRRAEALDPQNVMAQALFGDISPLPAQDVRIAVFDERKPSPEEERPAWMTEVEAASTEGPPLTEGEAALVDIAAALEAQIEIPSWLEEIDVSEAEAPEVPAFMAAMEEPAEVEEPALTAEEEAPGWMAGGGEDLEELGQAEDVGQEGVAGEPDWLAGVGVEPSAEQEEMPGKEKVPDFLSEMEGEAFAEEPAPSEEAPDWLAGLREQAVEDVREPAPADIPDWMQELAPSAEEMAKAEEPAVSVEGVSGDEGALGWTAFGETEVGEVEEPVLGAAEEPAPEAAPGAAPGAEEVSPPWLEGAGMPSGEEALAWLEQLAAGKEEELQAQVEAEVEARTAEIMGRPKAEAPAAEEAVAEEVVAEEVVEQEPAPAEVEAPPEPAPADIPDWMQELAPGAEGVSEVEEPAVSVEGVSGDEGALGWTAFGETEVGEVEEPVLGAAEGPAPEAAPGAEEVSPPWLEGAGMPSGEEALAWLEQLAAGKEEELQAQVEAEVEARTAEIMGRPKAEAPAAEEVVAEEVVAEEVVEQEPAPAEVEAPPEPAPAEIPDWVQALAPSAEEAPEAEEAFGWTAFGESEAGVPEALASDEQEVMPVMGEAAPEAPSVPSIGEPPSVEEAPEAGEVFGWTAFGEPDAGVPGALASDGQEVMPVMGEAAPEAPSVPSIEEPPSVEEAPEAGEVFGWTAFGEPEEAPAERVPISPAEGPVVGEVPPPSVVEEVVAEAVSAPVVEELVPDEVGQVVAPSAEEPETPPAVEVPAERAPVQVVPPAEVAASEERAAPAAKAPSPPKPKPSAAEPTDPFAAEKAYLKENPRDYDARLKLARALWQAGRRREALEAYGRLVRAGKELDVVTTELEGYLEQWPDVSTQRVLGDAYMKNNQLEKALALYRQALESL